jgi:hypothetical protein
MDLRDPADLADLAVPQLDTDLVDDAVVVDLRERPDIDLVALADLPRVLVGVGDAPRPELDVIVPDEHAAGVVAAAVAANPIASTSLVLHLRAIEEMSITHALVAESATYSMLQSGPEHQRWLLSRAQHPRRKDDTGERVRVRREGERVSIELVRPDARNAVDAAMQQALVDALFVAEDADEIVLTGEGPVFSAGGDLDEFGSRSDPATAHLLRVTRSPARALARVADRTTVVVHGACHGAGVELAAFAGRVVARRDATFTLPEVSMGLVPGAGGTVSIARRIGRQRTAWLALTGSALDLPTAVSWGLVDEVQRLVA